MRISVKQVFTAVIAMVISLAALFLGQRVYQSTVVSTPLIANLGSLKGVNEARLVHGTVVVSLKPGSDLMTVYQNLVSRARAQTGRAPAGIVVKSRPDAVLKRLQASVPFVIAQGQATGQFIAMKANIEHLAKSRGATVRVEMDSHRLYLTFSHQGRVFYDVVPITIGGGAHA